MKQLFILLLLLFQPAYSDFCNKEKRALLEAKKKLNQLKNKNDSLLRKSRDIRIKYEGVIKKTYDEIEKIRDKLSETKPAKTAWAEYDRAINYQYNLEQGLIWLKTPEGKKVVKSEINNLYGLKNKFKKSWANLKETKVWEDLKKTKVWNKNFEFEFEKEINKLFDEMIKEVSSWANMRKDKSLLKGLSLKKSQKDKEEQEKWEKLHKTEEWAKVIKTKEWQAIDNIFSAVSNGFELFDKTWSEVKKTKEWAKKIKKAEFEQEKAGDNYNKVMAQLKESSPAYQRVITKLQKIQAQKDAEWDKNNKERGKVVNIELKKADAEYNQALENLRDCREIEKL